MKKVNLWKGAQSKMFRKLNITTALTLALVLTGVLSGATAILASTTSNFKQTINPGTLATDIVDASYVSVSSPSVTMSSSTFSFECSSSSGIFGTASEQIYVSNGHAANDGWTLSLAASSPSDLWASAGTPFDFNNPAGSGCTGGQMTVNPSAGAVTGAPSYSTTGIVKGSAASFSQGVTDTVTLLSAAASSLNAGKWVLTGVDVSQAIPAEQPAATDYNINMVLSIVAL